MKLFLNIDIFCSLFSIFFSSSRSMWTNQSLIIAFLSRRSYEYSCFSSSKRRRLLFKSKEAKIYFQLCESREHYLEKNEVFFYDLLSV